MEMFMFIFYFVKLISFLIIISNIYRINEIFIFYFDKCIHLSKFENLLMAEMYLSYLF